MFLMLGKVNTEKNNITFQYMLKNISERVDKMDHEKLHFSSD